MQLHAYFPILLFMLIGILVGVVPQLLGKVLAPGRPDPQKASPYECGFEAFEDARMKFDVRFYLIAIMFIIFDIEVIFLVPWAVAMGDIGTVGFAAGMVFLTLLTVGLAYEWKKGAMDWD